MINLILIISNIRITLRHLLNVEIVIDIELTNKTRVQFSSSYMNKYIREANQIYDINRHYLDIY